MDNFVPLQVRIIPNPVQKEEEISLHFTLFREGLTRITVLDYLGKTIRTESAYFPTGNHTLSLPTQGWAAGTYWIRVDYEGQTYIKPCVVRE